MSYFEDAYNFTFDKEVPKDDPTGGYTNDPQDSGGETKYGVSKEANPDVDIKNLTQQDGKMRFKTKYWKPEYELLNKDIAIRVFDMGINSGAYAAEKTLQRAINNCGGNVMLDGEIGSKTIAAANAIPSGWLLDRFRVERSKYYADTVTRFPVKIKYLKGWILRNYK